MNFKFERKENKKLRNITRNDNVVISYLKVIFCVSPFSNEKFSLYKKKEIFH